MLLASDVLGGDMGQAFVVRAPTHHALRALNYTPEVEAFKGRTHLRSLALRSLLSSMGPAYGTVFTRIDCDRDAGVELITQGDMFAAEPVGRVIRLDSMSRPDRHRVRRWQVLIAGAGTLGENELYGRSIIADGRLVDRFVGPHAMVLTFEDEGGDLNLYTYAFLCSRIGIKAIRSASFGTKILGVRKDMLANLPVPIPDDATVGRIATLVREAVKAREEYARCLATARAVVEAMPEMQEARAMCAARRARCVAWSGSLPTISAWNFASTGGALGMLLRRWEGRVGDAVDADGIFYGLRCVRVDCDAPHGVPFLSQRDVFLMRPIPRRIRRPDVPDEYLFAPAGSIVMAGRGTLGEGEIFARPTLVTPSLARNALTEDLLRIRPKKAHEAVTYTFFSTLVGLRLLRSTAVGTKILNLRTDLLRRLPLPELNEAAQRDVRARINDAVIALEHAATAEAEAIRVVEEEVLPQWLA